MKSFFIKIFQNTDLQSRDLIGAAGPATLVKIGGMLASIGVSIVLGRYIGVAGLGLIGLANRATNILLVFVLLGVPQVLIKNIAIAREAENWQHVGDYLKTSFFLNGIIALIIGVTFYFMGPFLAHTFFNNPMLGVPMATLMATILPITVSRIYSSALIGLGKIWQGNLFDQTFSTTLVIIALLIYIQFDVKITIIKAVLLFAIARVIVALIAMVYWHKNFFAFKGNKLVTSTLLESGVPLFIVSLSGVIFASSDIVLLGLLSNPNDLGLFTVAAQITLILSFFLKVINSAVAPKIAGLYHQGKLKELGVMMRWISSLLSFIGILCFLVIVFCGKIILGFWGADFEEAYPILLILGFGQLINISTGAVGQLLIMTGHEKTQSRLSSFFIMLNLILGYFLIKGWGGEGAAFATAATIALINLTRVILVKHKTGIIVFPWIK